MTKDQIIQEYQKVATQAGDLFFRWTDSAKLTKDLEGALSETRKRKDELEKAMKAAQEAPAKEGTQDAVVPAAPQG